MGERIHLRRRLIAANGVALAVLAVVGIAMPALATFRPVGSPLEMARAIDAHHVHGYRDDLLTPDQLSHKAATEGYVLTTCGTVSLWALDLYTRAGYQARIVTTLTLDHWDSLDNGHTMISVHTPEGWAVYDLDRGVRYTDPDGAPLSVAELVERVPTDAYEVIPLNPQPPYGEGFIREANHRLMQVAGIGDHDGRYWFAATGPAAARVSSYAPAYRAMDPARWEATFYAKGD